MCIRDRGWDGCLRLELGVGSGLFGWGMGGRIDWGSGGGDGLGGTEVGLGVEVGLRSCLPCFWKGFASMTSLLGGIALGVACWWDMWVFLSV